MANFPQLKTGAVMQYPAERTVEFSTEVLRFVDGSEQRYRDSGAPLRRWAIRLSLLDESEMARIEEFFEGRQGQYGSFAFTDPWDGATYPECSLEHDELVSELRGEGRGQAVLLVRENGS